VKITIDCGDEDAAEGIQTVDQSMPSRRAGCREGNYILKVSRVAFSYRMMTL